MRIEKPRERQKLFAFIYKKKPKQKIQQLLGRTEKFTAFFRLGKKPLAESISNNFVKIHEIGPSGKMITIGNGYIEKATPSIEILFNSLKLPKKKIAVIEYWIEQPSLTKTHLGKGIGTRIVSSLVGFGKKMGYERLVAVNVESSNIASKVVLRKNGFTEIPWTGVWYKEI